MTGGRWAECTPANVENFSAVGFFFAEALHAKRTDHVPIALIHTAMGGTAIESWIDLYPNRRKFNPTEIHEVHPTIWRRIYAGKSDTASLPDSSQWERGWDQGYFVNGYQHRDP